MNSQFALTSVLLIAVLISAYSLSRIITPALADDLQNKSSFVGYASYKIIIDQETGCHYVSVPANTALTPRLNADGTQLCTTR